MKEWRALKKGVFKDSAKLEDYLKKSLINAMGEKSVSVTENVVIDACTSVELYFV